MRPWFGMRWFGRQWFGRLGTRWFGRPWFGKPMLGGESLGDVGLGGGGLGGDGLGGVGWGGGDLGDDGFGGDVLGGVGSGMRWFWEAVVREAMVWEVFESCTHIYRYTYIAILVQRSFTLCGNNMGAFATVFAVLQTGGTVSIGGHDDYVRRQARVVRMSQ